MTERCGDCRWYRQGECWERPPTPLPMPRHNPLTGETQIVLVSVRPPVAEGAYCGRFVPAKESE